MAEISAGLVRDLRERTGGGMMDCKRALEEAGGDLDVAARLLREKGIAKADKKAGRATSEGRIAAVVSADRKQGALVEVCSETDFVAKTDEFAAFGRDLAQLVCEKNPKDLPELLALRTPDGPVEERLKALIGKLGENMLVRRFELIPDTGGAGRWRGGCGIRKDIELRADRAVMPLLGERHSHTGYGLFGGASGSLAETVLNPDGEVEPKPGFGQFLPEAPPVAPLR